MRHSYIVSELPTFPEPEQLVSGLLRAGIHASLTGVRRSLHTAACIEIALGPGGWSTFIDVSEDFEAGRDLATSEFETVCELIGQEETRHVRRLFAVRAWEYCDRQTVGRLVQILCELTGGRLVDSGEEPP